MVEKLRTETIAGLIGPAPTFHSELAPSKPSAINAVLKFFSDSVPSLSPEAELGKLGFKGFQSFIEHYEDKANYEFLSMLGEEIENLKSRVDTIVCLIQGDELPILINKYLHAFKRITSNDKRELLRNALLNRMTEKSFNGELEDSFLELLESLSPKQIYYIKLGREEIPESRSGIFTYNNLVSDFDHLMNNLHVWKEFQERDPNLPDPSELTYWIKPLLDRGLLIKQPGGKVITSSLGHAFLAFIAKRIS